MSAPSIESIADLRSGRAPWPDAGTSSESAAASMRDMPARLTADVLIVGAGITGAFLAERLTRRGLRVVVIDRHASGRGSTAASTSLLLWELDAPLRELEDRLGFATAARIYRRSYGAVRDIAALVAGLDIPCRFAARDSLYLAGDKLDPVDLGEEHRLRRAAGFAAHLLDAAAVRRERAIQADGALLCEGAAEADPVALAAGLMAVARRRGAQIFAPLTAVAYDASPGGVAVATDRGGQIAAKALVLATGYDMPDFVPATAHRLLSTWALATAPRPPGALWPARSLIWEASNPYLYMRTTPDGRILAGGADEPIVDPAARDALTARKIGEISDAATARFPPFAGSPIAFAWSGAFGVTVDGLPLIGAVPGMAGCYAAFGYGGNGITFSAIAADMIDRLLAGARDPDQDNFALDRGV